MSTNSDTVANARSMRDRAISRGADLLAAYASDPRGWGSPTTAQQVLEEDAAAEGDLQSIAGDLIADILHALNHAGGYTVDALRIAEAHYLEEQVDEHAPAAGIPVEYVPAEEVQG